MSRIESKYGINIIQLSQIFALTPSLSEMMIRKCLLSQSKTTWNGVPIANPVASAYRNKNIDHWDEICTLFAMDRATGQEAEQHEESVATMEKENETCSASEANSAPSNKRIKRDSIVDAISKITDSFEKYLQGNKPPSKSDSKELYDVVSKVVELDQHEVLKAKKLFLKDTKEFDMLKGLLENEKLDWVLLCLNS